MKNTKFMGRFLSSTMIEVLQSRRLQPLRKMQTLRLMTAQPKSKAPSLLLVRV